MVGVVGSSPIVPTRISRIFSMARPVVMAAGRAEKSKRFVFLEAEKDRLASRRLQTTKFSGIIQTLTGT